MKRRARKLDTVTVFNTHRTRSAKVHRKFRGRGAELGIGLDRGADQLPVWLWLRRGQARRMRDAITKWLEVVS